MARATSGSMRWRSVSACRCTGRGSWRAWSGRPAPSGCASSPRSWRRRRLRRRAAARPAEPAIAGLKGACVHARASACRLVVSVRRRACLRESPRLAGGLTGLQRLRHPSWTRQVGLVDQLVPEAELLPAAEAAMRGALAHPDAGRTLVKARPPPRGRRLAAPCVRHARAPTRPAD